MCAATSQMVAKVAELMELRKMIEAIITTVRAIASPYAGSTSKMLKTWSG